MSGQLEFGEEDRTPTLIRAWELALHLLASKISTVPFNTYIQPIQPLTYIGSVVTLGIANAFFRERLEKNHLNAIRSALEFHLDTTGIQVVFVVMSRDQQRSAENRRAEAGKHKSKPGQTALPLEVEQAAETEPRFSTHKSLPDARREAESLQFSMPLSAPPAVPPPTVSNVPPAPARSGSAGQSHNKSTSRQNPKSPPPLPIPSLPLNERYKFDTYLVGHSNRLAHAGATSVAARPGEVYNPLFLYGGPGLGKTHLMQAIAHQIRRDNPKARIAYVSGEYFAQHYISSINDHNTEEFRRQYRDIDVWLVDDIQFIASKEKTKEEFFHTFNTLYQSGKQVVIASDRSPRELNTMDERLRSRFQSGLIADISAPELETRIAILQQFRKREGFTVANDVLDYIASAIQSNIRALEGALTKLIAYSSIHNTSATAELAQSVLSEYFIEKPIRSRKIGIDDVIDAVAPFFDVAPAAIKGPNRNKDVSLARQVAMYLSRELMPELNMANVGEAFGNRDHATIVYACQRVRGLMDMDPELKLMVTQIQRKLSI